MLLMVDEPALKLTPAVWSKWDGKLYNWALCFGSQGRSSDVSGAYEALDTAKRTGEVRDEGSKAAVWESPEPPGLTVDALDTNALVIRLPAKLYAAVQAHWAGSGPLYLRADSIGVHENTLRNRAEAAVVELEIMDGARQRGERINPVTGRIESPAVVRRTRYVPDDMYD